MTTRDRGSLRGLPADSSGARALLPAPPAPGGSPPAPPAAGPVAYHEAAHAVAAWAYCQPMTVVSIRPGATYGGIVMFEDRSLGLDSDAFELRAVFLQPPETRAAIERRIVISLAGPIAGEWARMMAVQAGWWGTDPCQDEAERAAKGLADLSPRHRELIVTKEAETTPKEDDETRARTWSWVLNGEPAEEVLHLEWLRATTRNLVRRQWPRISRLAAALQERTVLSGDDAVAVISPPKKEIDMRNKKPEPAPVLSSGGVPIVIAQPLTIDHPHARVATRSFPAYFVSHPGGFVSPGITYVREGSLADDRSALVLRYRDNWRRPTAADRAAASAASSATPAPETASQPASASQATDADIGGYMEDPR